MLQAVHYLSLAGRVQRCCRHMLATLSPSASWRHGKLVCHLDIKPDNVLLSGAGVLLWREDEARSTSEPAAVAVRRGAAL